MIPRRTLVTAKNSSRLNHATGASGILLMGLIIAQILSTIMIYLSNADLYQAMRAINEAGYLSIPNQRTLDSLREFSPAVFGGLFFTFSTGAALSIYALGAVWTWDRLLSRNRFSLIVLVLPWIGCIIGINHLGVTPLVTSLFLVVPLTVITATLKWMPPRSSNSARFKALTFFIPIALLAALWSLQLDDRMFLDIRDKILLSNPVGIKINDFYYQYTLYPAEVFKSLDQKIIRTCNINTIREKSLKEVLERKLRLQDYLKLDGRTPVDLKIVREDNLLIFQNKEKKILQTSIDDFLSRPETVLKRFSSKSDRHAFFRQFTFFSLLIGFPVALYFFLYALLLRISSFFLNTRGSCIITAIACLSIGAALWVPLYPGKGTPVDAKGLEIALESERLQERVAALQIMLKKRMEIGNVRAYGKIMTSAHIAERYWFVRVLGASRKPESYRDLLTFLDDPHPNVASMAYYALENRKNKRAVTEIIKRIKTIDHWYVQWYAYKALRALGWKQTRSK